MSTKTTETTETTEPYRQTRTLTKGRIVIFRGVPRHAGEPIGERPAIIVRVYGNATDGEQRVDLTAFFLTGPAPIGNVAYSHEPVAGTWCWVDEQDMRAQAV